MKLIPLREENTDLFKKSIQEAFQYGYESVYGKCDDIVIPDEDIEKNLKNDNSFAFEMIDDHEEMIGGTIVTINENTKHNHLDILFVKVGVQNRGVGQKIWKEIEKMYPETLIWETCTPYFDKRNIHFYVNRLGFHVVELFNEKNPDPNEHHENFSLNEGMFRFEKKMIME